MKGNLISYHRSAKRSKVEAGRGSEDLSQPPLHAPKTPNCKHWIFNEQKCWIRDVTSQETNNSIKETRIQTTYLR